MSKTCSNLEADAQKILWSNIEKDKYKNIITNAEQMDVAWLIESDWNEYWHGCINPF